MRLNTSGHHMIEVIMRSVALLNKDMTENLTKQSFLSLTMNNRLLCLFYAYLFCLAIALCPKITKYIENFSALGGYAE